MDRPPRLQQSQSKGDKQCYANYMLQVLHNTFHSTMQYSQWSLSDRWILHTKKGCLCLPIPSTTCVQTHFGAEGLHAQNPFSPLHAQNPFSPLYPPNFLFFLLLFLSFITNLHCSLTCIAGTMHGHLSLRDTWIVNTKKSCCFAFWHNIYAD